MRTLLLSLSICISTIAFGQVKTQVIKSALPKTIRYLGKPVQTIKYQDNTGTYLALTTKTGEQPQKGDDEFKQAHLYAYVYQMNTSGTPTLLWQLQDMVTDCNLDIVADFVPGSLTITDLDKNGKAEVWVAYRLSCKGDVSPNDLKIIMHEGTTKYAKRGVGKIKVGGKLQPDGGEITSDEFKKAPVLFKQQADQLWKKYVLEAI
jgi:hypothetical protein